MNLVADSRLLVALISAAAVLTAGCGDESNPDDDGGSEGTRRVAQVDLAEVNTAGTYVSMAEAHFWREPTSLGHGCSMEVQQFASGECTITTVTPPVCSPACGSGQICAWTDGCTPQCIAASSAPPPLQAGDIAITGGSGQAEVIGTPDAAGNYQFTMEPSDWWSDADVLTVSAPGATFPGFSVDIIAPPAPAVTTDLGAWTPATFTSGVDVPVTWQPGDGSHQVVVAVMTEPVLLCITEDDGSFDIPADGIAALGDAPAAWMVAIDYTARRVLNGGADGETVITADTSGASVVVSNP